MGHTDPMGGAKPLSVGQEGLWLLHKLAPDSATYNLAGGVRMEPAPDPEVLARAARALTERHPMLRSVYVEGDGGPRRVVKDPGETGELVVREVPDADDAELDRLVAAEAGTPFRLSEEGPFRVVLWRRRADAVLLALTHHIATDAISQWLLWRDLLAAYEAFAQGREWELPPTAVTYDHFVEAERDLLASSRGERQAEFWREQVAGSAPGELLTDKPRPATASFSGASLVRRLPDELAERLKRAAAEQEVSQFALALGALQALINRWTGQTDFLVACPASVRRSSAKDVVGYYVNPVLIRAVLDRQATLGEVTAAANDRLRQATARSTYPYPLVAQAAAANGSADGPLYRISMTMVTTDRFGSDLGAAVAGVPLDVAGVSTTYLEIPHLEGQCDIALEVTRDVQGLTLALRYDTALFERATVERLFDQLIRFMTAAGDTPDRRVSRVPLTDAAEKRLLLALGSNAGDGS
ncbi:condensation domain-containing protein [Streptomyces sp. cmx-18-6]|uniref:condensation domain-containing protein n=1 Tax=Streptomyces sp. cmx-18-6 TaxID=2790930 RepID=UPI003980CF75